MRLKHGVTMKQYVTIQNTHGQRIEVPLSREGTREVGMLLIDGISYHLERINAATLQQQYRVDTDMDYTPQRDRRGRCVLVAPFSKR